VFDSIQPQTGDSEHYVSISLNCNPPELLALFCLFMRSIFFLPKHRFVCIKFVGYNRAKFHAVIIIIIVDTEENFILIA
jgi:hypothetical protein